MSIEEFHDYLTKRKHEHDELDVFEIIVTCKNKRPQVSEPTVIIPWKHKSMIVWIVKDTEFDSVRGGITFAFDAPFAPFAIGPNVYGYIGHNQCRSLARPWHYNVALKGVPDCLDPTVENQSPPLPSDE